VKSTLPFNEKTNSSKLTNSLTNKPRTIRTAQIKPMTNDDDN